MTAAITGSPHLRVLLVEDDASFVEFLRVALAERGEPLELVSVGRLHAAVDALGENGIDAVLLDLNLPDSLGLATLGSVTAAAPHVPVVVLTGVNDAGLATEAVKRGAQDWLTKGELDPELVARAVRYAIERKRLEDRLLRSHKLEAVGRLAGTVAHEFNNVLTVIMANVQMARQEVAGRPPDRQLSEIERASARGAALTQQLLGFTRAQPVQASPVDAAALVEDVMPTLRAVLPARISLESGLPLESGRIRIDRGQFEQMLLNLALNARDAMPEGGALSIRTLREVIEAPHGTRADLKPGPYVVVEVGDTGTGIDPDVLPRIFEPFFTTKKDRGTGLGLAMCQEILMRCGGTLAVRSEPGTGATFLMYLPEVVAEQSARTESR